MQWFITLKKVVISETLNLKNFEIEERYAKGILNCSFYGK